MPNAYLIYTATIFSNEVHIRVTVYPFRYRDPYMHQGITILLFCFRWSRAACSAPIWIKNQGLFSISYLEAQEFYFQVTWPFSDYTPSDLASKSLGGIPSDFGCWLQISWVTLTSLFVFVSFEINICDMFWYVLPYMCKGLPTFCPLIDYVLDISGFDSIASQTSTVHGSPWCCIMWCHNSVDADAWRRQQPTTRRTMGCVPK